MKKKVEPGKTYIGVVMENVDPDKQGRLKIKVLDIFEGMETEDLPWASPWKDLNGNEFNVPEKGKVLIVVFDQGDINKPEFIFSDHYNINLENKLKSLSESDYVSMKSLIYDHRTQIYVNESEGLKIDHKYNNINIKENSINLNLKDNNRQINIGDETANQQMILGNHWMNWFDEFVNHLMGQFGGAFLSPTPCLPNPTFMPVLLKYKALRDPVFLSHHVNVVDNNKTSTVKGETSTRQDEPQLGDTWVSTKEENTITSKTNENFKPVPGEKPKYDENKPPVQQTVKEVAKTSGSTQSVADAPINPITGTPDVPASPSEVLPDTPKPEPIKKLEPLTSPLSNKEIVRLMNFMNSKNYTVYEDPNTLNMVGIRTKKNRVTNVFDEQIKVFFKDDKREWQLFEYDFTTVPGLVPGEESLPEKVKILALGQYVDLLRMDFLNGDQEHQCLSFDGAVLHTNTKRNQYDFSSPIEQVLREGGKEAPCYIHRSNKTSSSEYVFNMSEGSQVFKSITHYEQFMKLCQNQISLAKKDVFTYTLIDSKELEASTVVTNDEIKVNKFEKYIGSGTSSYLSQAQAKARTVKQKAEDAKQQAQDFVNTKIESVASKIDDKKVKAEALALIATLKIEGYFKADDYLQSNNSKPQDDEVILKEKVNLGAILKRVKFYKDNSDSRILSENEISETNLDMLKNLMNQNIPKDVDKNNVQFVFRTKTEKRKDDQGTFIQIIGSAIEFLPKSSDITTQEGKRPVPGSTTTENTIIVVGYGDINSPKDPGGKYVLSGLLSDAADDDVQKRIKSIVIDNNSNGGNLKIEDFIKKDEQTFLSEDGSYQVYCTYESQIK